MPWFYLLYRSWSTLASTAELPSQHDRIEHGRHHTKQQAPASRLCTPHTGPASPSPNCCRLVAFNFNTLSKAFAERQASSAAST